MARSIALLLVLLLGGTGCGSRTDERPDIFLIVIDALRADHLGCYGYSRETSPVLDSLAAAGTLFTRFQAQSPWTLPSHASIWTGLTVRSHMAGMRDQATYGLDPGLETIATLAKSQGYITLGFVNTILIGPGFGFAGSFDHYACALHGHGRARETVDEVLAWFYENRGNPAPKLTVIHLFDVHAPYDPPEGYDSLFAPEGSCGLTEWRTDPVTRLPLAEDLDHMVDLYDGEIAWTDAQLGRLFAELRRTGVADNALFFVTADHGEEFLDHGSCGHSHTLYQELLHVPLILAGPGIPVGRVDSTPGGQFDLLPTIAGCMGVPAPAGTEGVDLLSEVPPGRVIPSSGVILGHYSSGTSEDYESLCSVLDWPRKGIVNFLDMEAVLYDLGTDPGESAPTAPDSGLMADLEYYWSSPPIGAAPLVYDPTVEDQLQDLGYIR